MACSPIMKKNCARMFGNLMEVTGAAAYDQWPKRLREMSSGDITWSRCPYLRHLPNRIQEAKLTDEMNKVTKPLMGVIVGTVDINRIKMPDETRNRLLENGPQSNTCASPSLNGRSSWSKERHEQPICETWRLRGLWLKNR